RRRLEAVRLVPALARRRIETGAERLAALARVMGQLHPEGPLARGYVIVRSRAGRALTSRAAAAGEPGLVLQFADGTLDAVPAGSPAIAHTPPRRPARPAPDAGTQEDLFG
ncbi:MAG: exodeoxyribonuclease VII large subunit, partial [Erythrobacter cryptus]